MRSAYSLKRFGKFNLEFLNGFIKVRGSASQQELDLNRLGFVIEPNSVFFKNKSEMYLFRALMLSSIARSLQVTFKKLTLKGIGFKCYKLTSHLILLKIGYTHKIYYDISALDVDITCKKGRLVLYGNNVNKLNNVVYNIMNFRKPDSYKGKGIIFTDQVLKLKSSKKRA